MSAPTTNVKSPTLTSSVEIEVSPKAGRYLTGIYWLSQTDGEPARTGDLGAYLDVSPASVTEMLTKLDDQSVIEYEKHHGATLTETGEHVATEFAERQCIVTQFFCSVLDTELDPETAFEIGQRLPDTGINGLHERIDKPCTRQCKARAHSTDVCLVHP